MSLADGDPEQDADDDIAARVYGDELALAKNRPIRKKADFAPWHHPIKQIVRDYQWGDLAKRLFEHRSEDERRVLRYFTLPGADLFDVRVLSRALEPYRSKVEYFGFNVGYVDEVDAQAQDDASIGSYFSAESSLRQSGRITDNAVVLPDRLEDIAEEGSQASNRLEQQRVFDIVNIDACEHLGFVPTGRSRSLFNALETLLKHQLTAKRPWLLFITTRVAPDRLGEPAQRLKDAISENLKHHLGDFGPALADCIGGDPALLNESLEKAWSGTDENLLRVFSIGLGKFLLQFFHSQPNLQADVEMPSVHAYRVHGDHPDMLAIAFRISPKGLTVQQPTASGQVVGKPLELKSALSVLDRANKLWNLEEGIELEEVKNDAVLGMIDLLDGANYDLDAWIAWLAAHKTRPLEL